MQCKKCNTDNDFTSKFCKECGEKLEIPASMSDPNSHLRIGELIYAAYKQKEAGRIEDAILACHGVLALNDQSAAAHSLLASLYELKGDIAFALREYEKAVELNPSNEADIQKLDDLKHGRITKPVPSSTSNIWVERFKPYVPHLAAVATLCLVLIFGMSMIQSPSTQNQAQADRRSMSAPAEHGTAPQTTTPVQPNPQYQYPQGQYAQQQPATQPQQAQQPQEAQQPQQSAQTTTPQAAKPAATGRGVPPVPVQIAGGHGAGSGQGKGFGQVTPQRLPAPVDTSAIKNDPPAIVPVIEPSEQTNTSGGVITHSAPVPQVSMPSQPSPSRPVQTMSPEERARKLQSLGKYEQAISAYREALNQTNDSGRVYQQIGMCYQRLGQREMATDSYQRAIRSYGDQLKAGKDPASIQKGIQSCEYGIQASQ